MSRNRVLNRLRELRRRKGLTQQELADAIRISRQSVNSIERGRFLPSIETALHLARTLEIAVDELFWLEENEE